MIIVAFTGLNAFSNLREQRSSQMRHPVHFEASALIGGPFLGFVKVSLLLLMLHSYSLDVKSVRMISYHYHFLPEL